MTPDETSVSAADLGSLGGKARAESLTPEERSEQARHAVEARWEKAGKLKGRVAKATHGSPDHPLKIGDIEIPCYVLSDKRRVLHQRGMVSGLGMSRGSSSVSGGDRLAKFVSGKALSPYLDKVLPVVTDPIKFIAPNGMLAYGYEATILADICEAVLKAREGGKLQKQQLHIAARCEVLVRGFARVGIIALVDEVTGFQDDRAPDALAKVLEAFVAKELQPYVKTFPLDYYKELCRLRGKTFSPAMKLPRYFGHLTNNFIYRRLAPGVFVEIQKRNPANRVGGRRKNKNFQWLTEEIGNPKLLQHLGSVVTLMKISENEEAFNQVLDKVHPIWRAMPLFDGKDEVVNEPPTAPELPS